jgi:recombinational DNA repair protein RecT
MSNQLTTKEFFNRQDVKQKFAELLGKRATSFITSVLQIAAQNSLLAKADPEAFIKLLRLRLH